MRLFKLSILFFISALFLTACNRNQAEQAILDQNEQLRAAQNAIQYDAIEYDFENRVAKENLDLQAIGELLEDAETAEELEYRLNSPEYGVNNLDLNGDSYADYISVREFGEGEPDERGFSLFSMFGPEMIQEIATIIFDRDRYNDNEYYPGSRVLITGNEQIYGDNYYYETNWLERTVPIVSWIFTDRDNYYASPYYYENYPSDYQPYTIVETPVYQTRIDQYYTAPVFVQTYQPAVTAVKIKSPYRGKTFDKVYSQMAKPTKQQVEFIKSNPKAAKIDRQRSEKMKNADFKPEKPFRDKQNNFERQQKFEKQEKFKPERQQQQVRENQQFRERPNKQEKQREKFERQNQVRFERQQPNFERQKPAKIERQQQMRPQQVSPQQMKPQKQANPGGGGNNKGGGGGNGKGNGGGGGKKGKG